MSTNQEKQRIWQAYCDRRPSRVPVVLAVNPRVVILDDQWNPSGITYEDYCTNAAAAVEIQLAFMRYRSEFLLPFCDRVIGACETEEFFVDTQNTYDAAYFGAPIHFRDGQVPDTTPILAGADRDRIFRTDISRPLDNPFVQQCLRRWDDLTAAADGASRNGKPVSVQPLSFGFDGPLTIAVSLRGQDIFLDLYEDPPYVRRLLEFIQRGVEIRNRALAERFGYKVFEGPRGFLADDSIQLISTDMYADVVLPLHRAWYANWSTAGPHDIHLCGDATRHFPILHEELNVCSFDTGFPVDHGALRKTLGNDVEILGGPEIALLLGGSAEQVYDRTREILLSGVMDGGRFVLREANNLPPGCPAENLAAMYRCCHDHGRYP